MQYAEALAQNKFVYKFSEIEDAVLNGEVDLGVIIHENRFTYQDKGLLKVLDLGEYWEQHTGAPIPLGCIAVRSDIKTGDHKQINKLIKKSLEFAFSNYPYLPEYVKQHAQEMNEDVMRKHIELYVNNFSVDLGDTGKNAIETMYKMYLLQNRLPYKDADLFV